MRSSSLAAVLALSLAGAGIAAPVNVSFFRVEPHNSSQNPAAQFSVSVDEVIPGPGGRVSFTFRNNVGIASSISEVYFDDGTLLGISSITQGGASFVGGSANPGDLPGGQNLTPPFHVTQGFLADAQGNPSVGIDTASDFLTINFNLINNKTFADTIWALQTGGLRIGMHVRAIGTGGQSDAFVNNAVTQSVPLPTVGAMGVAGLMGLGAVRRRSR
jgi:MYXO-CTERM domain-containing protein